MGGSTNYNSSNKVSNEVINNEQQGAKGVSSWYLKIMAMM